MMDRKAFENRLSDYLQGLLSAEERRALEAYLAAHPEAAGDLDDVRQMLALTASIAADKPPEGLLEKARAPWSKEVGRAERRRGWLPTPRLSIPAYGSAIAAVLVIAVAGILWPWTSSGTTWADVVATIRQVRTVRVVGWVRGEKGESLAFRQWLQAPHFFRAELGEHPSQSVVVIDDERRVIHRAGKTYWETLGTEGAWSMERVASLLALPAQEHLEERSYQIKREEQGKTLLFTIWPRSPLGIRTPGYLKFRIEVDRTTRLPLRSQVLLDRRDSWELVSELEYLDYDEPVDPELFQVSTAGQWPLDEQTKTKLWFERAVTPLISWNQALYQPLEGMEVVRYDPSTDPSKGISSSARWPEGGTERYEFHRTLLPEMLRQVVGMPVETADSALARQPYSLHLACKSTMSQEERVARLCAMFGLRAELEERQGIRTRFVFRQNQKPFPASSQAIVFQVIGRHFQAQGVPLRHGVSSLFNHAALNHFIEGYNRDIDILEMRWDGSPEENPFDRLVDIDIDYAAGWSAMLAYLEEHFGVELERIAEPVIYEVLVLHPHAQESR